jgi:acetylornithine deacetylase
MTLNDHGTRLNVSAGRTTCALSIRNMPNVQNEEAIELICAAARKHSPEATVKGMDYFYASPDNPMAKLACEATGVANAETVPYGTEAVVYQSKLPNQVVLGPGNIAQAHTVGEWIEVKQLTDAVGVYRKLIERACTGT